MGTSKACFGILVWLFIFGPWVVVCQADTLGDTTLEPVANAWTALYATGNVWTYTGSVGFVGQGIYVYLESLASPFNATAAVYQTSGGAPSALLSTSALLPVSASQWYYLPISPNVNIIPGQTYFICVAVDGVFTVRQNVPPPNVPNYYIYLGTGLPYPASASATLYSQDSYSIYLSGPEFTPTSSATPILTSTPTATPTSTSTSTKTSTSTATSTLTSTSTVPFTLTSTSTATPTLTGTVSRTLTPTISPTLTATHLPTFTYTVTPRPNPSATITPLPMAPNSIISYPVPAHGREVWFYFNAAKPGRVEIEIYNVTGEKIVKLGTDVAQSGPGRLQWDLSHAAPGIYLYRTQFKDPAGQGSWLKIQKFVVVR